LFVVPRLASVASATAIDACRNPAVWVTTSKRFKGAEPGDGVPGGDDDMLEPRPQATISRTAASATRTFIT
jgi:hypothetical protein